MMSLQKKRVAVALAVVVAGTTIGIWLRSRSREAAQVAPPATAATSSAHRQVAVPPVAENAGGGSRSRVRPIQDPSGRDALLERIRSAKQRRTATPGAETGHGSAGGPAGSSTPPQGPDSTEDAADREYIQLSVEDIAPLLVQCYEQGRARDPKLAGLIVVDFTIEGEPGVGGLVTQSKIDPKESDLADESVRECIQESMYAIEIEPPSSGGVVTVRYPFRFGAPAE